MIRVSDSFTPEQQGSLVRLFRDTYADFLDNGDQKTGNRRLALGGLDFYLIQGAKNLGANGDAHHAVLHRPSDGAYIVLEGEMGKRNFRKVLAAFLPEGDPVHHAGDLIGELQGRIDALHETHPDMMEEGELNPHRVRAHLLTLTQNLGAEEVRKITTLYIVPSESARQSPSRPHTPTPP